MKNTLVLFFAFLALPLFSQSIAVNEVDEFTGNRVLRTEWERIGHRWYIYIRFSTIGEETFLNFKMVTGDDAYHYPTDKPLMIKFEDGEILELYPIRDELSCVGCGSIGLIGNSGLGVQLTYLLNDDQLSALQNKTADMIRVYSSESYWTDEIRKNKQKALIKQCAQLATLGH